MQAELLAATMESSYRNGRYKIGKVNDTNPAMPGRHHFLHSRYRAMSDEELKRSVEKYRSYDK